MKTLAALVIVVHLVQCRPIDFSEGWSTEEHPGGVIAKIVCQCDAAGDSHQATYALATADIRQTCSEGDRLCDAACQPQPL